MRAARGPRVLPVPSTIRVRHHESGNGLARHRSRDAGRLRACARMRQAAPAHARRLPDRGGLDPRDDFRRLRLPGRHRAARDDDRAGPGWWLGFGDPALSVLIERALADNPTLKATLARVELAAANASAADAAQGLQ